MSDPRWSVSLARSATAAAAALLGLAACAGPPSPTPARLSGPHPATRYKLGPPYQVGGVWYAPADQPGYMAVGVASWYGRAYQGRTTADGERFDASAFTGAHPTLPLPSWVEIDNLENGRSARVRLNDRGAFRRGRVVDVSHAVAEALGFAARGTARVRVRYLGPAPLDPAAGESSRASLGRTAPPS